MNWDVYARVRTSRWVVPALGILWTAALAGIAAWTDVPEPGALPLLLLAFWLLAAPGMIGLAIGRKGWIAPVAIGLALFALLAPDGLGSTLGNLAIPAAIVALLPAVAMTALGVAFWAPPPPPDPEPGPDAEPTPPAPYQRPRWRRMLRI